MTDTKRIWPSAESAVAAIMFADIYANARLHFIVRVLTGALISAAILLFGVYALLGRMPQYRYILTTPTGIVVNQVPMDKANQTDQFVIDWTTDAITRLYTFDFDNYRNQFQDAKVNLTAVGWDSFEKSMALSGNFNAVLGYKYVTTAAPTGPGKIVKTGTIEGNKNDPINGTRGVEHRYAWKVQFPMVISYRSSKLGSDGKPLVSEQNLTMSVTVIRQPEYLNAAGLGIRAIVAE